MRKSSSLSLGGITIGGKRERPYKTAWLPISCCLELDFMWFYVHLLPASAHNREDLSVQNELSETFLLLNWASKSFTSSPDVSVFWANRNLMYSWLSLKIWASTNRGGGNSPLYFGNQAPAGAGLVQDASQVNALTKPFLNHWEEGTQVWPTAENSPHLQKILVLLKF